MRKKIGVLIITGILLATSVQAFADSDKVSNTAISQQDNGTSTKEEGASKNEVPANLNFEDAVKLLNQNMEIKLFDKQIEVYQKKYDDAVSRRNAFQGTTANSENVQRDISLVWKQREIDLADAKHQKENKVKSVKNQVEKEFLDLTMAQEDIDNMKKELDNLNTKMEETKLKIQLGQLTDVDLKNLEAQKSTMNVQLEIYNKNLENSKITLKKDLGIDLNATVSFAPLTKEFTKFNEEDLNNRIQKEAKEGYAVEKAKKDLDALKVDKYITERFAESTDPQVTPTAAINVAKKEMDVEDLPTTTEATLWASYYNLRNLEDNIEIAKIDVESAERDLRVIQAKAAAGLNVPNDEITSRLAVNEKKTSVKKAINEYMKAKADYEDSLVD